MIYLASPYSHEDRKVMQKRFEEVASIAAALIKSGYTVFSPIIHSHPIAMLHGLPTDYEYWEKVDREMIALSEKLLVVKLDGWESSKGLVSEVQMAQEIGIPVEFIEKVSE